MDSLQEEQSSNIEQIVGILQLAAVNCHSFG